MCYAVLFTFPSTMVNNNLCQCLCSGNCSRTTAFQTILASESASFTNSILNCICCYPSQSPLLIKIKDRFPSVFRQFHEDIISIVLPNDPSTSSSILFLLFGVSSKEIMFFCFSYSIILGFIESRAYKDDNYRDFS